MLLISPTDLPYACLGIAVAYHAAQGVTRVSGISNHPTGLQYLRRMGDQTRLRIG